MKRGSKGHEQSAEGGVKKVAVRDNQGTMDAYIAGFSGETREILEKIRQVIREVAPRAEEAMRYGIPTFRLKGKNLVHFAAFRHHIGFFPTPSAVEAFRDELSAFTLSKGTIRFPLDRPVPYDLIRRIVLFRVGEITAGH